jgi:hypothetical protein
MLGAGSREGIKKLSYPMDLSIGPVSIQVLTVKLIHIMFEGITQLYQAAP